jgi:hypothetical protein
MSHNKIEELDVYMLAEEVSNEIWDIVLNWDLFARYHRKANLQSYRLHQR